jgi:hypothetical protein
MQAHLLFQSRPHWDHLLEVVACTLVRCLSPTWTMGVSVGPGLITFARMPRLANSAVQAANGSTKTELKRTSQMALRHLGY